MKKRFTLIELIIAMGILVILMGVLMFFFSTAQQIWSGSTSDGRVMDNSRVIFEVIENDMFRAVANRSAGSEIPFHIDNDGFPTFVSAVGSPHKYQDGYNSKLCEVSYSADSISGEEGESFMRRVVYSGAERSMKTEWDFLGVLDGKTRPIDSATGLMKRELDGRLSSPTTNSNWYSTADTQPHSVCGGLSDKNSEQIIFKCYGEDPDKNGEIELMGPGNYNYLPIYVDVSFTLFDEDAGYSLRNIRGFYRRIYLRR